MVAGKAPTAVQGTQAVTRPSKVTQAVMAAPVAPTTEVAVAVLPKWATLTVPSSEAMDSPTTSAVPVSPTRAVVAVAANHLGTQRAVPVAVVIGAVPEALKVLMILLPHHLLLHLLLHLHPLQLHHHLLLHVVGEEDVLRTKQKS